MPLLAVGDPAPSFSVKDHTGQIVRLADFDGKQLVLWFYPKADTPGCTLEACGFRDRFSEVEAKGVAVLGVSFDSEDENRAFAEKYHFPFKLLCDADRALGVAYGATEDAKAGFAKRISYLIGEDGRIKKVWGKVDVKTHAGDVLKAADE